MEQKLMHQTMRWYGPKDPVSLSDIRQAGCSGVVTALHHIAVGDIWEIPEIENIKQLVEAAGMTWMVIESLPVSEDIKRRQGNYELHISNYIQSLKNVAACGLKVVTYNFMPVLDWLRTNISYELPDGARALYFERTAYIVFDVFLLERKNADKDYSAEEMEAAQLFFSNMTDAEKQHLFQNLLLGLPGSDEAFTPQQVNAALENYSGINADILKQNLFAFLQDILPAAEEAGINMAIHPDDPPYPVLGLPRIMSTAQDVEDLLTAVPSAANGLCFCTGSFGARPDNDIVAMLKKYGDRIHFLHLRNTKRDAHGNFYEAQHLGGDTDMFAVIKEVFTLQQRRQISLPMRPDHGHQILDDLHKQTYAGYSAIGRLKGLAEIRGVEYAIARSAI